MKKVKQIVKQSVRRTGQSVNRSADLASKVGSPSRTRTYNLAVNSRSLYH